MAQLSKRIVHLRQVSGARLRLDRIDVKILATLQDDGRITNLKLAETVGLSPTPCLQRVRRLEAAGYIRAYGAMLDVSRLGSHIIVHTEVRLQRRSYEDAQRFERYIRDLPLAIECYLVGGDHDYLVKIVARDVNHYQEIMDAMMSAGVGVERFASFIALKEIKQSRIFPLALFQPVAAAGQHASGRDVHEVRV